MLEKFLILIGKIMSLWSFLYPLSKKPNDENDENDENDDIYPLW